MPYPVYFWIVLSIALVGLLDSAYLAVSHYRVYTDMGYKSFCAVSKAINCDTVSQSEFSIFLHVPVPIWGIIGYLFFLMVLFCAWKPDGDKTRFWPTLALIAFCFSVYSVILAAISTFYIRSFCIMCIVSYAANFLLLYFSWLTYGRFSKQPMSAGLKADLIPIFKNKIKSTVLMTILLAGLMLLIFFFPAYWQFTTRGMEKGIPTGTTHEGHPWIGAQKPQLTIMEFTDYQCFQCKKMHFYLRELIAVHPEKIRLVHRNFPMDHAYNPLVKAPLHVGSGKMALFSLYAAEKENFWQFSDMLFEIDAGQGIFNIRAIAKAAGFDVMELAGAVNNPYLRRKLDIDMRDGLKLGITGTPGYLIDGQVHVGQIPPGILAMVME